MSQGSLCVSPEHDDVTAKSTFDLQFILQVQVNSLKVMLGYQWDGQEDRQGLMDSPKT